ncbi:cobyrinic acid a,c-diamide synthase [Pseudomonas aeruginosa]|nr:cobyrinic acid a,c-diamide synthase [Pseudomonas aeruginosa]
MANAHELARGHKRLRALIEFAVGEGWHVKRTPGGHLKFTKAGCAAIYTSSTASDHRARIERPCADPPRRARGPHGAGRRSWGLRGVRPWLT